jgi:addiction module RelE/StbE family toxin
MTYQLTTSAKEDLLQLNVYLIKEFGVDKANEALLTIRKEIEQLRTYPLLGVVPRYRSLRLQGYRYLIVEKYYIFYKVQKSVITIIRIIHQKQTLLNLE